MDLAAEADRLRLDLLAVRVSDALLAAGVPHALLKGPTTSTWLYDPPRPYRDVDVLVPRSRLDDAVRALATSGTARRAAGRVGEEAPHGLLLRAADGFEIDLHVSLPTVPPAGDRVWDVLAPTVVPFALGPGIGSVPALAPAGRCLVLALHALGDPSHPQPVEDLRRAVEQVGTTGWRDAHLLAERLDVVDLFTAGLGLLAGAGAGPATTRRAHLHVVDAPPAAFGLQRLRETAPRSRPAVLWRELVPSRGFMLRAHPEAAAGTTALLRAHARRWSAIAGQLPGALRAHRNAPRPAHTRGTSDAEQHVNR